MVSYVMDALSFSLISSLILQKLVAEPVFRAYDKLFHNSHVPDQEPPLPS